MFVFIYLISELKAVNSGISINDLNIRAILLADDTTLLSTSAHGLQRLLDYVQNYACRYALFVLSVVLTDRVINVPQRIHVRFYFQ
jgi:hypothetical protein